MHAQFGTVLFSSEMLLPLNVFKVPWLGLSFVLFHGSKQKTSQDPESRKKKQAALHVGSKGIERSMHRRLRGSFEKSL